MSSCYWKLGQTENVFNVDCKIRATGRKIFSVVIFTSNHFRRRAKRERERERTHRRANKEREREIASVRLPSSSPPRDGEIAPWTHELIDLPRPPARSRHEPTNRSTHPSSSSMNPRIDRATIGLVILIFFVLIFVSCVVYMLQLFVIIFVWILRKCEKHDKNGFSRAFSAKQQNTRKYFPKYFLECNQTLENIFLSQKYFQIFTWKYFILEKYFTFNQFNQTQPKSLIYWESDKK